MKPRPSRFARRARKEVIQNKAVQPVEYAKQDLTIVHLGGPWYTPKPQNPITIPKWEGNINYT